MKISGVNCFTGKTAVEVLVWLAVCGVFGSTALSTVGQWAADSVERKGRHDARVLVKIFEAAEKSGISLRGETKEETISKVVTGAWATQGPYAGTFLGVPEMPEVEMLAAGAYLGFENGGLIYWDTEP